MFGSPKPEQIHADAQRNGEHSDDCCTKRNCHTSVFSPADYIISKSDCATVQFANASFATACEFELPRA
jgi:hypothetical protein